MGISLKRLYGWEPVETSTVTAWDDQGRPTRWETTREQEWDRRERSLMQALALYEAGLCQRCGQHLQESMDPDTNPDNPQASRRWVADGPDECFSCMALVRAERALAKDEHGGADMAPWTIHSPALVSVTPRRRIHHH